MIKIDEKDKCCGCYGCSNICPKKCITMAIDEEGFWYPQIDLDKCIDCKLCEKVCPVINSPQKEKFTTLAYACRNKDELVRLDSSSGGVFTMLYEEIIKNNGVVFGASFDEMFEVRHTYAETLEECIQFRGSKYVQSKIGDSYSQARKFLDNGRVVLFSGTQCQIKGLNLYLGKNYANLITVDIICHGVPSPMVFRLYKQHLSKANKSEIKKIKFRDKTKGWKQFSYVTEFENGSIYSKTLREDNYMKGFLSDLYLRPSCYNCKAKNYSNGSDISLADYWGVENKHPKLDDDKGVSLVLINSKRGNLLFDNISNKMEIIETDLEYAIQCNPCIVKPVKYNQKRDKFFKELKKKDLITVINNQLKINLSDKLKSKIKHGLYKLKRR